MFGKPACFVHKGLVHLLFGDRPLSAMGTDPARPSYGGKHSVYSILNDEWTEMPKVLGSPRHGTTWGFVDGFVYTFKSAADDENGFGLDVNLVSSSASAGAAFSTVPPGILLRDEDVTGTDHVLRNFSFSAVEIFFGKVCWGSSDCWRNFKLSS